MYDNSQSIRNHCHLRVFAFKFMGTPQSLLKGCGKFHVHVGNQFRPYQIGHHDHVVVSENTREDLGLPLVGDCMAAVNVRHTVQDSFGPLDWARLL